MQLDTHRIDSSRRGQPLPTTRLAARLAAVTSLAGGGGATGVAGIGRSAGAGSVRIAAMLSALACLLFAGAAEAQERPRTIGVMPKVLPQEFVQEGSDLARHWQEEATPLVKDRLQLFRKFAEGLVEYAEFKERVAAIYPVDQLEWLLITDEVADSLVANWIPVLDLYQEHHRDEVLSKGRQLFELEIMKITGPPTRMLGFHALMLADYAMTKSDSLITNKVTDDLHGLADGVLRSLRDWCELWHQVHNDPLSIYESRLNQEDWIVARLEDNCGNRQWRITNQYMAFVGTDSTKTPPEDRFAHEFHLSAQGCDDQRVILIDLPNFNAMQRQVMQEWEASRSGGQ